MDPRSLAALLSSLISELLLLLLTLPSSNPLSSSITDPNSNYGNLFSLLHHYLSTSEIATSLSLLSRKRKRTHHPDEESTDEDEQIRPKLGQLVRVDSAIPKDPDSFKLCFKMSSSTFEWLAGLLEPLLECRDPVGSPINLTAETRLGIGLFRLSTGADYQEISRRFRVSEPVSKFCVKQLCRVLCTNFRFWVGFPNPNELLSVSMEFETLTGIPNCCGVIDCTRFKIVTNNGYNLENSIAAQIVVDSNSRILSIIAGFRGEKSNLEVLESSTLCKDIELGTLLDSPPIYINGVSVSQYLVGDRGKYPLKSWLIVPFLDPVTGSYEENFNGVHCLMRVSAIRTIKSLKSWGVLSKPIEAEFKTAVAYVGACSILHNALLMREDYSASSGGGLVDYLVSEERRSESFGNVGMEEGLIEREALVIRSALATRAKEVSKSDQLMDPQHSGDR